MPESVWNMCTHRPNFPTSELAFDLLKYLLYIANYVYKSSMTSGRVNFMKYTKVL